MSRHKAEKVNIVGHSLGGVLATLIASTFPEKINQLILIESFGPLVDNPSNSALRLKTSLSRSMSGSMSARVYPTELECVQARTKSGQISEIDVTTLAARGVQKNEEGYFWNHDRFLKVPSAIRYTEEAVKAILGTITCPVTLIYGTSPIEVAKPLIDKRISYFREITTHVLPGGHHLHMSESTDKTAEIINQLL